MKLEHLAVTIAGEAYQAARNSETPIADMSQLILPRLREVRDATARAAKLEVLRELEQRAQVEETRMRASGFPSEHVAAASWGAAVIQFRKDLANHKPSEGGT